MTSTHAHNIWLQAAVERGFLGMLALLWLMAALLREALRAQRQPGTAGALPRALAVGGLAALCGFLIDGLVQNNFGDSQAALLFWVAAGVVVVCGRSAALPATATETAA
jgi:O-antigen ligase